MTDYKGSESHLESLYIVEETESEVLDRLGSRLLLHEYLVELVVDVVLEKPVELFHVVDIQNLFFGDLKHLDDGRMDGFLACQEEQVQHHLT